MLLRDQREKTATTGFVDDAVDLGHWICEQISLLVYKSYCRYAVAYYHPRLGQW